MGTDGEELKSTALPSIGSSLASASNRWLAQSIAPTLLAQSKGVH